MTERTRSTALAERLARVESPGVTTFSAGWPIFWQSARGTTVTCADGHEYTDLTAAFGVASVGHANPVVVDAIAAQAGTLMHGMGDVHPPDVKVALLEALAARTPGDLSLGYLGLNGADAVEAALKCAELVTGKPGVIAFEGAYHGLATGALGVTARRDFRDPFAGRGLGSTTFVEFPQDDETVDRVISTLRRKLSARGSGLPPTGAVIVEPIQGRGGVVVPPDGFLRALRELCDEFDLLLIADEIFTGFGRTGAWFGCDHEPVVPDLMCLGKALGGGMPISACVGNARSFGRWPVASGEALHTATFLGNPVSCAAALAALGELERLQLPARAARLGAHALSRLTDRGLTVRGRGLMLGVVCESGAHAWSVVEGALDAGVVLLPSGPEGEVLSLTPPLVIEDDVFDAALDVVADLVLANASNTPGDVASP